MRKFLMPNDTAQQLAKLKAHIDQSRQDAARIEGQIKQLESQRATEFGCPTDAEAEEYILELEGDVQALEKELAAGVEEIQRELGW
jgi:predicted  nucleic acid-binding Zn-ribbon protein